MIDDVAGSAEALPLAASQSAVSSHREGRRPILQAGCSDEALVAYLALALGGLLQELEHSPLSLRTHPRFLLARKLVAELDTRDRGDVPAAYDCHCGSFGCPGCEDGRELVSRISALDPVSRSGLERGSSRISRARRSTAALSAIARSWGRSSRMARISAKNSLSLGEMTGPPPLFNVVLPRLMPDVVRRLLHPFLLQHGLVTDLDGILRRIKRRAATLKIAIWRRSLSAVSSLPVIRCTHGGPRGLLSPCGWWDQDPCRPAQVRGRTGTGTTFRWAAIKGDEKWRDSCVASQCRFCIPKADRAIAHRSQGIAAASGGAGAGTGRASGWAESLAGS